MSDDRTSSHGVAPVKSAERTIAILEYLSSSPEARSLREITQDLDLPRASAYALLTTLLQRGWVEYSDSRYRLGVRSLRASAHFVEMDETVRETTPVLDELSRYLDQTIHLARLDGNDIVYMVTRPSSHSITIVIRPGRRLPTTVTALGKVLLASRPWSTVESLLPSTLPRFTANTLTSRRALQRELERIRDRGYAIDNQESTLGLRCFAVPVDLQSPPLYAISCSILTVHLTEQLEHDIINSLLAAKRRLGPPIGTT